MDKQDRM